MWFSVRVERRSKLSVAEFLFFLALLKLTCENEGQRTRRSARLINFATQNVSYRSAKKVSSFSAAHKFATQNVSYRSVR